MYFSGVSSVQELSMLQEAGVKSVLVDQFDLPHCVSWPGNLALDSGAYRAFKKNLTLDVGAYVALIEAQEFNFDFVVTLDVIGDAVKTRNNWRFMRQSTIPFIPVYQWSAKEDYLLRYLDESYIVGIGGLVSAMRDKNQQMYDQLGDLINLYPHRFHIFGMNWLKALEDFKDYVASADTSKFLDGARYGHVIFTNTRTGHLSQAPASALVGSDHFPPEITSDRRLRCVLSAKNMEEFCAEESLTASAH